VQRLSTVPAATFAHIPEPPHAWQRGQLATPQQCPSVHRPVPHSWAPPQLAPEAFFGMHAPFVPVQKYPLTQSASLEQPLRQATVPQT